MKLTYIIKIINTFPSPPTRGRGLKQRIPADGHRAGSVAPHTGAWVETVPVLPNSTKTAVAPHTGAWVETSPLPVN